VCVGLVFQHQHGYILPLSYTNCNGITTRLISPWLKPGTLRRDLVIVESRSDLENWPWRQQFVSKAGKPLVDATTIDAILQRMKPLLDVEKPAEEVQLMLHKVYEELRSAVPEPFPPMPKFEIV